MKRRTGSIILGVALVHIALTVYAFVSSLYFTFPGELGFEPVLAQRADTYGNVLAVLGFPILSVIRHVPVSPLFSGLMGWVWFALNSLLWGLVAGILYKWIVDVRSR